MSDSNESVNLMPYRQLLPERVRHRVRPNNEISWGAFIAEAAWYEKQTGRAYIWIRKNDNGEPIEAYVLNSENVVWDQGRKVYRVYDPAVGPFFCSTEIPEADIFCVPPRVETKVDEPASTVEEIKINFREWF